MYGSSSGNCGKRRRLHSPAAPPDHLSPVTRDGGFTCKENNDTSTTWAACVPPHPCGVRPGCGIASVFRCASTSVLDRASSLGALEILPDGLIIHILEYLEYTDLGRMIRVSKVLFIFASDDALWKRHSIDRLVCNSGNPKVNTSLKYTGQSWKESFCRSIQAQVPSSTIKHVPRDTGDTSDAVGGADHHPAFRNTLFYSDVLYTRWMLGTVSLDNPTWFAHESVDRRSGLSRESFQQEYERTSRPVLITDVIPQWPAFQKWDRDALIERYGSTICKVAGQQMLLQDFFHYSQVNCDTRPMYLFDSEFGTKLPDFSKDYTPPIYFDDDFFRLLTSKHPAAAPDTASSSDTRKKFPRPDYRWLIIGPERSGSSFHVDPNGTCAWSAVLSGKKKWILYPPHILPPGVEIDESGGFVTAPSLIDWMMTYYPHVHEGPPEECPLECVCSAGEIMFVPSGWWHCVINIEESIAITHNVVTENNLLSSIDLLAQPTKCAAGTCRGDVMGDVPLWVAMGGATSSTASVYGNTSAAIGGLSTPSSIAASPNSTSTTTTTGTPDTTRTETSTDIASASLHRTRSTTTAQSLTPISADESANSGECACDRAKRRLLTQFRIALEETRPGLENALRQAMQERERLQNAETQQQMEDSGENAAVDGKLDVNSKDSMAPTVASLWDRMKNTDTIGSASAHVHHDAIDPGTTNLQNTTNGPAASTFAFGFA